MKNCGDGGAGGSRAGCRGLRPLPGFGAAPQNLCRSTTSQALRAAKGRKKRGSLHPHRFPPSAPTTRFAALANIGVLRAGRAQPLYLLTPAGRFALRATAHRADASLRRAHGFAALANIGVLCAAAHSPCICSHLRVALRFAQQPAGLTLPFGALRVALPPLAATAHRAGASLRATGLTLPSAPPGWRFPSVSQNLCRSTTSQALRAAKGRKKRGSFHPHRFPHPGPQGHHPPAAHLFAPLRQGFAPCAPKPAIKPYQQRSQSP